MQEHGHCCNSSRVQVVDRDHLILITVVPDDTLDQNVEWLAQEDIVCGVAMWNCMYSVMSLTRIGMLQARPRVLSTSQFADCMQRWIRGS